MAYDFIILYLCCVKIIKRVMKKLECIWNRIYDNSEVGLYSLTVSTTKNLSNLL